MKKVIAVVGLLALGGCQTAVSLVTGTVQNPVSARGVYALGLAYNGFVQVAANYSCYWQPSRMATCDPTRSPPRCSATVKFGCADRAIVLKLQAADRIAGPAVAAAEDWVRRNPQLNIRAAIDAVNTATLAIQAAQKVAALIR